MGGSGSPDGGGPVGVEQKIAMAHRAAAETRDPLQRYILLSFLANQLFEQRDGDPRSVVGAVHVAKLALATLPDHDVLLDRAAGELLSFVKELLGRGADPTELPDVIQTCRASIGRALPGPLGQAMCARYYAELLFLFDGLSTGDALDQPHVAGLLDDQLDAFLIYFRTALKRDPFLRQAFHNAGYLAFKRYRARRDIRDLDLAIDACRTSAKLDASPAELADVVNNLFVLGAALSVRLDVQAMRGLPIVSADLDEAIAACRRTRQDGATQEERDTGSEHLFKMLVRRFRIEGHRADLDDVIALHGTDLQRMRSRPGVSVALHDAPGARFVEEAFRLRAEITGSQVDSAVAALMRWYLPGAGPDGRPYDINRVTNPEGYTVRAAKSGAHSQPDQELAAELELKIARLRAAPDLERRVDLLDQLVDALAAFDIATGSAKALDELIEADKLLIRAIPEDDIHHQAVHRVGLGAELYRRRRDAGGGPEDAREAFTHLEYASGMETLETKLRIWSARIASEAAGSIRDWPAAARMSQLAVDLLPLLVPRHLTPADHARLLAPLAGLVPDAAAAVLRAGDPSGAVELLEQGRGLLIGRALDARDGTTETLRRIADELATSADPHAVSEPGMPSAVDRRRELGRAWEREVARIRTVKGFEDYLLPARLADLSALAADGPLVTIIASSFGAEALLLTTEGVDVQTLPNLTRDSLEEMVDTFWGTLRFAELMPHDDSATVQAQEPLRAVLAWLWDTVAGPILDRLGPVSRIWWVPTDVLATLPLHAAGHDGESVLDRVISSYTPTIKALRASRSRGSTRLDTAGLVTVADTPGLPALPHTVSEAFEVTRRFPAITRLDGPAATPEAVLATVNRSGWLHLACHASSDPIDPAESALHVHSGKVTAREVMSQRAPGGRLAYLSACRTANLNGADIADEMIHLGSAFQIAGFRHVVGTLWEVKDAIAATAAKLFYEQVGTSEDHAAHALHHTVRQLRERYPLMPARWAPYIHLGA